MQQECIKPDYIISVFIPTELDHQLIGTIAKVYVYPW